jgi:hypothetical protein
MACLPLRAGATAAAIAAAAPAAMAQSRNDSVYTRHDWPNCPTLVDADVFVITRCEGHAGIPIWWALGDHGARLSLSGQEDMSGPFQGPWPVAGAAR